VVSDQPDNKGMQYLKKKGIPACTDLTGLQKVVDVKASLADVVKTPIKVSFAEKLGQAPPNHKSPSTLSSTKRCPRMPTKFLISALKCPPCSVQALCQFRQQDYQQVTRGKRFNAIQGINIGPQSVSDIC